METDTNKIIRKYLVGESTLTDITSTRIYCPRLPENCTLPALAFKTMGGSSNPHIPPIVKPTIQFYCYDDDPIDARALYVALTQVLQGIQNESVTIGADTYRIMSAVEEGQGQDFEDDEIPNYFMVLAFYQIEIET